MSGKWNLLLRCLKFPQKKFQNEEEKCTFPDTIWKVKGTFCFKHVVVREKGKTRKFLRSKNERRESSTVNTLPTRRSGAFVVPLILPSTVNFRYNEHNSKTVNWRSTVVTCYKRASEARELVNRYV